MSAIRRLTSCALSFSLFCSFLLLGHKAISQTPEGINYQAVARDNNGNVLSNRMIEVRFSILENSASGNIVYQETYGSSNILETNDFGLFNLIIGGGTPTAAGATNFSEIDWGNSSHFLQVEIEVGNGFEELGTTQLVSVPYALYAKRSGNVLKAGDGIQVFNNDSIVNLGDLSDQNEIITDFRLENDSLLIVNEGVNSDTVDVSAFRNSFVNQDLSLSFSGNQRIISITNGNQIQFSIADADSSVTNEIQTLEIVNGGDSIQLSNSQGAAFSKIAVGQLNITNTDNQNLILRNDSVLIDRGSGVDLSDFATDAELARDTAFLNQRITTNASGINLNTSSISANAQGIIDTSLSVRSALIDSTNNLKTIINNLSNTDNQQLTLNGKQLDLTGDVPSSVDLTSILGVDSLVGLTDTSFEIFNANGSRDTVELKGQSAVNLDNDPTNELVDSVRFNNRTLEIYQQGVVQSSLDFDTLFNGRRLALSARITQNSNAISVNRDSIGSVLDSLTAHINLDNDLSSLNERVDSLDLNGSFLRVFENGTLSDSVDLSPYLNSALDNQNLSYANDSILIENGVGIDAAFLATDAELSADSAVLANKIRTDSTVQAGRLTATETATSDNAIDIATNRQAVIDSTLATRARLADSIIAVNDRLADTSLTLRTLINNGSSDDQNLSFANDSILIENGVGIDAAFLATDVELAAEAARIDLLRTHFSADSTALQTHLTNDNDLSATNEIISTVAFDNTTRELTVTENGVDYTATIPLSTTADTTIVSGLINGTDIDLTNNVGETITIDITSLATDAELAAEAARIDLLRTHFSADSTALQTHLTNDNDLSATNEIISTVAFDNTTRELTVTENGVDYTATIPLSTTADTNIVSGTISGTNINLTNDVGQVISIDITSLATDVELAAEAARIDLLRTHFSADSTALQTHLTNDNDLSATNEIISAVAFDNTTRELTVTENGVDYTATIPLSTTADTTIVSGLINGTDIDLTNNVGETITIDITSLSTDAEVTAAVAAESTARTNADNALNTRVEADSIRLRTLRSDFSADSTALQTHLTNDNDLSATNEIISTVAFDNTTRELTVTENGVDYTATIPLSTTADTTIVSGLINGTDIDLTNNVGETITIDITSLATDAEVTAAVAAESTARTTADNALNTRVEADSIRLRTLRSDFSADSTALQTHLTNDNDLSATNEIISTVAFDNTTRELTITENGVDYTATIPLGTIADTNIVSGTISGTNINLTNDVGQVISIDITSLATDAEVTTAVAAESTARTNADNALNTRVEADSIRLRTLRSDFSTDSTALQTHLTNDNDLSATNEIISTVAFDNTTRELTVTENGVDYTATIPLSTTADTTIVSGVINGTDIDLTNNVGETITIDITSLSTDAEVTAAVAAESTARTNADNALNTRVEADSIRLRTLRSDFSADSTALQTHLTNDNDLSATNEIISTVAFDNTTRELTVTENGVDYTATIPLSTTADTTIVSGLINGTDIDLTNNVGETITIDITSLATDAEVTTAVAAESTARTNADNALNTRVEADSIRLRTLRSDFSTDSTALQTHLTNDNDLSATNEIISTVAFDNTTRELTVTENGVDYTATIPLSTTADTTIVSGVINGTDIDLTNNVGETITIDITSLATDAEVTAAVAAESTARTNADNALNTRVEADSIRLRTLRSDFSADSTALQTHLTNDNDLSATNEIISTVAFDNTTRELTVTENGVDYTATIPLSTTADTNIVSGTISGTNINLTNDVGQVISIDITSLATDAEVTTAVAAESTARTNADNALNTRVEADSIRLRTLRSDFSADSTALQTHLTNDNDLSATNEIISAVAFDNTTRELTVTENGVDYTATIPLSTTADTTIVSGVINGTDIDLTNNVGETITIDITSLATDVELAAEAARIDLLRTHFSADSTALQTHLTNDNDLSATNEIISTVAFDNTTRELTVTENGVDYTATIPLSTTADTNIVSGTISGTNINLTNDVGQVISIDITSLATDAEVTTAVAAESTARTNADNALNTRVEADSIRLRTLRSDFSADSTALQTHLTNDNDLSATNEIISAVAFDNTTRELTVTENGVDYTATIPLSTTADTTIVSGVINGTDIDLTNNVGETITIDITSLATDVELAAEAARIDLLRTHFSADSTALQTHLTNDNDLSVTNEIISAVAFDNTTRELTVTENGVDYTATIPLSTTADTTIVSGLINGTDIDLTNNVGETITIDITSLATDVELAAEAARIDLLRTHFSADSTALQTHLTNDNDLSATNEIISTVAFDNTTRELTVTENGVDYTATIPLSTTADTTIVSGLINGTDIDLTNNVGETITIDITSLATDAEVTTAVAAESTARTNADNALNTRVEADSIRLRTLRSDFSTDSTALQTHLTNDNDLSATNEIISTVAFDNTTRELTVTENGVDYTATIPLSTTADTTIVSGLINGTDIDLTNNVGETITIDITSLATDVELAAEAARIDLLRTHFSADSTALQTHLTNDNDLSATNEIISTVTFDNTTRELTVTENGVDYTATIPLGTIADTNIVSGTISGTNINLTNDVGQVISIDITSLSTDAEVTTAVAAESTARTNADNAIINRVEADSIRLRTLRSDFSADSTALQTHLTNDNDLSATNEIISTVTFDNTTRELTVTENGVDYTATIPLSTTADTTIVSGLINGTDIDLTNNVGETITIDITSLATDAELAAEAARIDLLRTHFSADSTALQTHLTNDNDLSATNEIISTVAFDNTTRELTVTENGVDYTATIPLSTTADTTIVSGVINGTDIDLTNNVGETITIDITSLATDAEVTTAVAAESTARTNADNAIINRVEADSIRLRTLRSDFSTDSTALQTHLTNDNDLSATNEIISTVAFDKTTNILSIIENGVTYSDTIQVSGDNLGNHTATTDIVLGGNYIGNDGDANEGISISNDGSVAINTVPSTSSRFFINETILENGVSIIQQNNSATRAGIKAEIRGANGSNAYALEGEATSSANDNFGLHAIATGAGINNYGVYGKALGATNNWSAYFDEGNVFIRDTLFVPAGAVAGQVLTAENNSGKVIWSEVAGDNLGNHSLDSNLKINNFYISADGDDEGITIDNSGRVAIGKPRSNGDGEVFLVSDTVQATGTQYRNSAFVNVLGANAPNATQVALLSTVYGSDGFNIGLFGWGRGSSAGTSIGTSGRSDSSDINIGVNGFVNSSLANTSNEGVRGTVNGNALDNYGVFGSSNGSNSNNNVGIYGNAENGATNWAGYFDNGNVFITDTLIINTGTFGAGKVLTDVNGDGKASWQDPNNLLGDTFWSLNGNSGLDSSNFIGTTDAQDLIFRTDNAERMRIGPTGRVGINTTNPGGDFHVVDSNSSSTINLETMNLLSEARIDFITPVREWQMISNASLDIFQIFDRTSGLPRMTFNNSGQVGVGTTTPDSMLTIAGGINAEFIRLSGGNPTTGQVLTAIDGNGKASWQTPTATSTPDIRDVLDAGDDAQNRNLQNVGNLSIINEATIGSRMTLNSGDTAISISTPSFSGNSMSGLNLFIDGTTTTTPRIEGIKSRVSTADSLYGGYFQANGGESLNIAIYGNADASPLTPATENYAGYFDNGNVFIKDSLILNQTLRLTKNPLNGAILTSDADGNATWETPNFGNVKTSNGSVNRVAYWSDTDSLTFFDDLYFDETNNRIGIGTTNPTQKLQVNGGIRVSSGFNANNGTPGSPSFRFESDSNTGMFRAGTDEIGFTTGGSEAMRIDASGNLALGTTTADSTLTVGGGINAEYIRLNGGTQLSGQVLTTDGTGKATWEDAQTGTDSQTLSINAAGDELSISGGNTLNIGRIRDSSLTDLADTALVIRTLIGNQVDTAWNYEAYSNIKLNGNYLSNDGGNEGITINDNGLSSLSHGLLINATSSEANYPLLLRGNSTSLLMAFQNSAGTNIWDIESQGNNLRFNETSVGTTLALNKGGTVGIGTFTTDSTLTVAGGTKTTYFTMTDGATNNYVLASDANGVANWTDPSTLFAGDGNGIYSGSSSLSANTTVSQGANTLGFTSTASNAFSVDGSTFSIDAASDRVGIGTASPASKFNVLSTEAVGGQFDNTATGVANAWGLTSTITGSGNGTNIALQTNASGATTNYAAWLGSGRVYVQDSLGLGTFTPTSRLDVVGRAKADTLEVRGKYTFPADTPNNSGDVIQFNGTELVWDQPVNTGNEPAFTFDNANELILTDSVSFDFVVGSTSLDNLAGTDDDTRMYFHKGTASFRVGTASGSDWNVSSLDTGTSVLGGVGNNVTRNFATVAGGINNTAGARWSFVGGGDGNSTSGSGYSVVVGGDGNTASDWNAFVGGGQGNTASGLTSAVIGGLFNTAAGNFSSVLGGTNNTAFSAYETVLGTYSTIYTPTSTNSGIATDRSFVIGNGNNLQRSDALIIYKSGDAILNGQLTLSTGPGGDSLTFPNTDGTAGQVLKTDGSGILSWEDVSAAATCPTGMKAAGPKMCIDSAERAVNTWFIAATTCTNLGYKLPTWAEWYSGVSIATGLFQTTDDWEWVDGGTSNTVRKVGNGGIENTANDAPTNNVDVSFRCVTYR